MVVIKEINTGFKSTGSFFVKGNSYTTGNLVVAGNLIADHWNLTKEFNVYGNLNILGNFKIAEDVRFLSTTDATTIDNGSLHVDGGLSIRKNLVIGGKLLYTDTSDSTNINNGSFVVRGGAGITKNLNIGETLKVHKSLILPHGTTSERSTIPRIGEIRFNEDFNDCEIYDKNNNWRGIFSAEDLDKDTKISISDTTNNNIIRVITDNNQRMIFGNNTSNGNIGIGLNFDNPKSTLDIQGNLSVSNNAVFHEGIILNNLNNNSILPIDGTIRYVGNDFEGYSNNKWISLTNKNYASMLATFPYKSNQFEITKITQQFKYGNRCIGMISSDVAQFGSSYTYKYEIVTEDINLSYIECIVDNISITYSNLEFLFIIEINNIEKYQTSILFTKDNYVSKIINIEPLLSINKNDQISIKIKASDTLSINADILITLFGNTPVKTLELVGDLTAIFSDNVEVNNNINVHQNITIDGNLLCNQGYGYFNQGIQLGKNDKEPYPGMLRYNSDLNRFEGYTVNYWEPLGHTSDLDTDTRIMIDEKLDEDIIRFYTEGTQKMIICNNSKSGNIGIGNNLNEPLSTLDIRGNLSVSTNAVFGEGIILKKHTAVNHIDGSIRFIGDDLELYMKNKWHSLSKLGNDLSISNRIIFKSEQFHIERIQQVYKDGNRIMGLTNSSINLFGKYYMHKYQTISDNVIFKYIDISIDNISIQNTTSDLNYNISIIINDSELVIRCYICKWT